MSSFFIYTNVNPATLTNYVNFTNPKVVWDDNGNQIIDCGYEEQDNIYEHLICVQYLPQQIKLYFGYCFNKSNVYDWDTGAQLLAEGNYKKCKNFILSEYYFSEVDAATAVNNYLKAVAHNKAERYLLQGGRYGDDE